jgi:hypothetical protein
VWATAAIGQNATPSESGERTRGTVAPGLVHFWDFEGDGTDHAGMGDGTLGAITTFAEPDADSSLFALGRSLERDETNVSQKSIFVLQEDVYEFGDGDFTIAFAYKQAFGDVVNSSGSDTDVIMSCFSDTGSGWFVRGFSFSAGRDGWMEIRASQSGESFVAATARALPSDGDPSTAEWRHFAFVYDRSGTGLGQWYINGEPSGSPAPTMTAPIRAPRALEIGGASSASSVPIGADGFIDRVRIYNFALSEAQVAQLAREVVDDSAGSCAPDLSGDGAVGPEDLASLIAAWGPCP